MLDRFVERDLSLEVDRHLHCLEPEKKDMNLLPIDQKGRSIKLDEGPAVLQGDVK